MCETYEGEARARGSPAALARGMAATALRRIGALLDDPGTDPRVLLQAAKLALAVAGTEDAAEDGFELRFTGGTDGEL